MKEIALTRGKLALVDDEDFEELNKHKWHIVGRPQGPYYAVRMISVLNAEGKRVRKSLRMHCVILGLKGVDHENGNGLDNQKDNLRPATQKQNNRNLSKRTKTNLGRIPTSIYIGVSKNSDRTDWRAQIMVDGKKIHLGYYNVEINAAIVYDEAAIKYFGEFARLNFQDRIPQ